MNNIIVANGSTIVSQVCKRVLNENGGSVLAGMVIVLALDFMEEMMANDYRLHFKNGDIEFYFEKNCVQS